MWPGGLYFLPAGGDEVACAQAAQVVDHRWRQIGRLEAPPLQVREVQKYRRHDPVVVDDDGDGVVVGLYVDHPSRLAHSLGRVTRREVELRHTAAIDCRNREERDDRAVLGELRSTAVEPLAQPVLVEQRP